MSTTDARVVEALRNIFSGKLPTYGGTVADVDDAARTCSVELPTGLVLEDVHLQPLSGGKAGLVCIPKPGADCIILATGGGEYLLLCATELDAVHLDAETEIVVNGGKNKGIAKSPALVEKYNALEDDLNALKNVFKSWVPVSQDGGAALKGAVAGWAGQQVTRTAIADIQNEKFTH